MYPGLCQAGFLLSPNHLTVTTHYLNCLLPGPSIFFFFLTKLVRSVNSIVPLFITKYIFFIKLLTSNTGNVISYGLIGNKFESFLFLRKWLQGYFKNGSTLHMFIWWKIPIVWISLPQKEQISSVKLFWSDFWFPTFR